MKAAIMGFGTIGSGVEEVLRTNAEVIAERVGEPLEIKYILDIRDFTGTPYADLAVTDYRVIADDPEVSIVVETMGGVEPAFTFVKAMLLAGKHVVTSNKALVADKGAELIALAKEQNKAFLFEASVGGGIPIIRPLLSCLTGDVIEEITGIINGTTNYILTAMDREGAAYADVLADAQEKGFAERDPSADVDGWDACRKIAILTSLAAGRQVNFEDIPTTGITQISAEDFAYAHAMNATIKLLASSRRKEDTYAIRVAPYLVKNSDALATVSGVFNAIFVRGNMLGDGMFYGAGAGKLPTASAVVGDMVDAARHGNAPDPIRWEAEPLALTDAGKQKRRFFVRSTSGRNAVSAAFGEVEWVPAQVEGETAFITEKITEDEYANAAEGLEIAGMLRVRS